MRVALGTALLVLGTASACDDEEPVTIGQLETEVFAKSCVFSTCHKGSGAAAGLSLEAPVYEKLVGVSSTNAPGRTLVIAGDTDNSYILEKLTSPTPQDGQQMPPTVALSEDSIDLVRRWIADGAFK